MENASELQTAATAAFTDREKKLFERAYEIAESVLIPNAQMVDVSGQPPVENLRILAEAGLVGVSTPVDWGGSACSGKFMRALTELLTSSCGTTWFVLTQHFGSCGSFAGSANPALREKYLRAMAQGEHWVGVGFGHLRRPDPPLRAEQVDGGYRFTGVAPWVTGWPILAGAIYGAALPDDRHVHAYIASEESAEMHSSPPIPLCAMNSSATTEVHFENKFVPDEDWVRFSSRDELSRGDYNGIAGAVAPALGCARGSLRLLRELAPKRAGIPAIAVAADQLEAEIDSCRSEAYRWAEGPKDIPEYKPNALRARTWAITLGVRAAHMAVAAAGGAANALTHPAQRLFREAMFYTLTAQTGDIIGATLETLSDRGPEADPLTAAVDLAQQAR